MQTTVTNKPTNIATILGNEQQVGESLMLNWPDEENWKVGDDQENETQHVLDLIHSNETINKWTELGNMTSKRIYDICVPVTKL